MMGALHAGKEQAVGSRDRGLRPVPAGLLPDPQTRNEMDSVGVDTATRGG